MQTGPQIFHENAGAFWRHSPKNLTRSAVPPSDFGLCRICPGPPGPGTWGVRPHSVLMHQDGMRTCRNSHPRDLLRPWSVWRSETRNGELRIRSVPVRISGRQTGRGGGRSGRYEDGPKLMGNGGWPARGRGGGVVCPQIRRGVPGPVSGLAISAGSVAGCSFIQQLHARPHAVPMRTRAAGGGILQRI